MLTDQNTLLHIAKVRMTTEELKKDERFPVFAVGLVLEPLTYDQARQLGQEVLGHCFTSRRSIHDGLTSVTVEIDGNEQLLIARMAHDVAEHCRLRHVRIGTITITKRDTSEAGSSTKSKKIGPQQPTLKATFHCLVDPAEKTHRDFLALNFGKSLFFTFEPETENLFTGLHTDADEDSDDEDEPIIPGLDVGAGDVLEEQAAHQAAAAPRRSRKSTAGPKLVKGKKGVH